MPQKQTKKAVKPKSRARKPRAKKAAFASVPQLAIIHKLENELGLPTEFCNKLLAEDDWSFVIKMHALLEAAITHLLVETLQEPRLRQLFSRMELSNFVTGKIAFAERLELIDKDTKRFIQKVSELRNSFVHDVTNVHSTLENYFAALDPPSVKGFRLAISWGCKDVPEVPKSLDGEHYDVDDWLKVVAVLSLKHSMKIAIWTGSLICLRKIYMNVETSRYDLAIRELNDMFVNTLLKAKDNPSEDLSSTTTNDP